jgi:hypothetical protein
MAPVFVYPWQWLWTEWPSGLQHCVVQREPEEHMPQSSESKNKPSWFLAWLFLQAWRWKWYIPLKRKTFSKLHRWKYSLRLALLFLLFFFYLRISTNAKTCVLEELPPSYSRNSLPFMGPKDSLLCSQEPTAEKTCLQYCHYGATAWKLPKARNNVIALVKLQFKLLSPYSTTQSKVNLILKTISHPLLNLQHIKWKHEVHLLITTLHITQNYWVLSFRSVI